MWVHFYNLQFVLRFGFFYEIVSGRELLIDVGCSGSFAFVLQQSSMYVRRFVIICVWSKEGHRMMCTLWGRVIYTHRMTIGDLRVPDSNFEVLFKWLRTFKEFMWTFSIWIGTSFLISRCFVQKDFHFSILLIQWFVKRMWFTYTLTNLTLSQ